MEFCDHHRGEPDDPDGSFGSPPYSTELDEWDQKFISVGHEMLFDLILAAHYLEIGSLM